MGYVYLITNDINDNKYVGITTRTIDQRWKEHCRHDTEVIGKAIKKYGIQHFQICQLEECVNEQLDEREKYWIKFYNSYYNGYNCTTGGRRESQVKIPEKCNEVKKLWDEGFGQKEIQNLTKLNVETVHNYLIKSGISLEEIRERQKQKLKKAKSRAIQQLDLDGNLIRIWESATIVEKELHINRRNIGSVCNGKRKTAGNYKWKYLEEENE